MRRQFPLPLLYGSIAAAAVLAAGLGMYIEALAPKDLLSLALSLVGTFAGATFAFRLNQEKERRKLEDERREALNRASFVLIRQWNAMDQLARQFSKYPPPFDRAFNMPAFKPPAYGDLTHVISELDFLIDSTNPGLLMELVIEQETFHQALEALRIRNEFFVNEIQPALEKLKLNRKSLSMQELESLLGERLFQIAVNSSKDAWTLIHGASESIPKIHHALLAEARLLFPGKKFITFERAA